MDRIRAPVRSVHQCRGALVTARTYSSDVARCIPQRHSVIGDIDCQLGIIRSAVVRQFGRISLIDRRNEHIRDTAQPEPADGQRCAEPTSDTAEIADQRVGSQCSVLLDRPRVLHNQPLVECAPVISAARSSGSRKDGGGGGPQA